MNAQLVLMIIAAILLLLAAVSVPFGRPNYTPVGWLGMFFWALSLVLK